MRPSGRNSNQLRNIQFERGYSKHAEGSCLVHFSDTKILCNVSFASGVPRFLKGQGQGWLTAEYGMLPRATQERTLREATRGQQTGRTQEIQRLIGRSLRAAMDLSLVGENTITIDCDVIQADGGTRTASITGAVVALYDACEHLVKRKVFHKNPLKFLVSSVSVGMYKHQAILDLDYIEDSNCDTDMNVVMNEQGDFLELQGTAEGYPFKEDDLQSMISLAKSGTRELLELQKKALNL